MNKINQEREAMIQLVGVLRRLRQMEGPAPMDVMTDLESSIAVLTGCNPNGLRAMDICWRLNDPLKKLCDDWKGVAGICGTETLVKIRDIYLEMTGMLGLPIPPSDEASRPPNHQLDLIAIQPGPTTGSLSSRAQ